MLGGIDPILIFNFSKLTPSEADALAKIPIVSSIVSSIGLPPIPIYLNEELTGLQIDSEDKSMDIDTSTETKTDGSDPDVKQKGINSTVKINMRAEVSSIGVTILSAMADLIFPKVTSREYSITYLNGAMTIFSGLLHSFAITQDSDNSLYNITLEISRAGVKTQEKSAPPIVNKITGSVPL